MDPLVMSLAPEVTLLGKAQDALYLIDFEPFGVLLDARAMRISSVNGIAKEALPGLLESGLDATAAKLAERYQVDAARIRGDLRAFAGELEQQGFLPRAERPRRSLTGTLLRGVYKCLARCSLAWKTRGFAGPVPGRARRPVSKGQEKDLRRLVAGLLRRAWLSLRILGWSETLRLWRCSPALPAATAPAAEVDAITALVDQVVREETAGQLLVACACKERALVASYCLRRLFGLPADVVVGVIPVPFQMHAWCVCEGRVLTDDPERIATFQPVLRFPLS
jgi:hypothetical protein